jgi:hypothetical protein
MVLKNVTAVMCREAGIITTPCSQVKPSTYNVKRIVAKLRYFYDVFTSWTGETFCFVLPNTRARENNRWRRLAYALWVVLKIWELRSLI